MPRSYVDNAYNRSVGRVGMPVGSMVISRSGGVGGGGGGGGGLSYGGGDYSGFSGSSTKAYVDNSYNRSVGRVGMPVGSMVISRSGGGGGGGGGGGFSSGGGSGYSYGGGDYSGYSGSSTKVYVDNSYNRSVGRVGLPVGSMVISRSGGGGGGGGGLSYDGGDYSGYSGSSRAKTYVDNSYNKSQTLDRAGLPKGNRAGLPKGNGWRPAPTKCGIVEILNKLLNGEELVGNECCPDRYDDDFFTCRTECDDQEPFDQAMYHLNRQKKEEEFKTTPQKKSVAFAGSHDIDDNLLSDAQFRSPKVYVDNYMNRKLGRAGKIVGTAVYHKDTGEITKEYYVDNPQNRKLGRVGKPRGSLPVSRKYDNSTGMHQGREQQLNGEEGYCGINDDFCSGKSENSDLEALLQINRQLERMDRKPTLDHLKYLELPVPNDDFGSCIYGLGYFGSCISGLGYLEPFEQVMYRLNRQYAEPSSVHLPVSCPL
ncbi:uncharacterized protein LOC128207180 [Mya arenaria]|uniref:uncharacterized protein LOC128207180 n=1 Tax=Mya arenaria TaxID=6604 RepID=UPI0022E074AA|nr:uncharacterized protein LOC128207180 [Mya arenaria]